MDNYQSHAISEFRAAGWLGEDGTYVDEMQGAVCNHILALLGTFADEGHSGSSAPYVVNLFKRLALFEPIAPLTGEDWEWNEICDDRTGNVYVYQNKRMSSVFKQVDRFDGKPHWLDGKVFWEWCVDPEVDGGKPFKSYFTGRESSVVIEFPWTKPDSPEYVFVPNKLFPNEVM